MNTLNKKIELDQLNKIIISYNTKSLKETLIHANYSRSLLPNLNNIPQFHNIVGLINFRLNDLNQAMIHFKLAIKINPNFHTAYYNLGLVYFNTKDLNKSYDFLLEALNIKKDYKLARDKFIELLSFYKPDHNSKNKIFKLNEKIIKIPSNIDFTSKITDKNIIDYFKKCKEIVLKDLNDISYNKVQIFRKKSIFLNCERHKAIFFKYNSIPEFCFGCFKVVIETKSFFDLLKVSLMFDQIDFFDKFNRKNMIDKKTNKDVFKSIIYCTSLEEVLDVEKKTNKLFQTLLDDFTIESKRGCHEYAIEYPNYKKIYNDHSKMMSFPDKWLNNEKKFDSENYKEGIQEKVFVHDTKKGISLHEFLVINNWFKDQKLSL
tara:strand:+ start:3285 stop:4409 length:1125 start_codon:yes stop_codon:yes gene_type:complete